MRYGDEIAMGDNLDLPERNCARTPMQWSTEPQGGFTKADKAVLPVISKGAYGFQHVNVAQQRRDPNSLLNWMERMIRMRKETQEIGWGDFTFIPTRRNTVLAMRYDWRNNAVLFLHNLTAEPTEIKFAIRDSEESGCTLVNLLSDDHSQPQEDAVHEILLEPYGYRWYRVCGLDYLLKRSEV